jgi:hypothetical protein
MKYPCRLLPLLVLLVILAGAPPVLAQAPPPSPTAASDADASHKAAAVELLHAMHSERALERVTDQVSQLSDRLIPPGRTSATPQEETAFRESLRKEARDAFQEQLNWPMLEPAFAQMYADNFSEAELKQLADFYKSPVGQKLLEKQPELATKLQTLTQQKVRMAMQPVTQKLRASVLKFRQDHPMASPSPGASPAGPSGPPAGLIPALPATPSASPSPTPVPPAAPK